MRRLLFVSNGHGEAAVAARLARDVRGLAGTPLTIDHLPLVGEGVANDALEDVGPRRAMPSGGLVAMGNVRALYADFRAGLATLVARQAFFLRNEGVRYDATIAVGDAYALALTLLAGRAPIYVGTAKSVYVAPYGPGERLLLRKAKRVFVRDEPTAAELRRRGVRAEAPGNVIVDLLGDAQGPPPDGEWLALLPGSREPAYADAVRLARVVHALAQRRPGFGALLSIAPALDAERFARLLSDDGWSVSAHGGALFGASRNGTRLLAWRGASGAMLRGSRLALGQAGTANEQAAAFGLPIVVLEPSGRDALNGWYRMRQRRLLGEALLIVPADGDEAAARIDALLADPDRMAAMAAAGRRRMGAPGGSRAIAGAILEAVSS